MTHDPQTKSVHETQSCGACRFWRLNRSTYKYIREEEEKAYLIDTGERVPRPGWCVRFPHSEDKQDNAWCGEFQAMLSEPARPEPGGLRASDLPKGWQVSHISLDSVVDLLSSRLDRIEQKFAKVYRSCKPP